MKGYPFEVLIPEGVEVRGAILSDHVKSLDWKARKAEFACKLPAETYPAETYTEVVKKLSALICERFQNS